MSFILDALKKSEAERKQQNAPGIASIPERGQESGSGKWVWIVVVLLVVNILILTFVVLDDDAAEAESIASVSPQPSSRVTQESFSDMVREAKEAVPAPQPVGNTPAEPIQEESTVAETPAPEPSPAIAALPTFNQLRADGTLQLPDMHLDIHVYSGQPAERFIFVNMSKYKESATLSEGPLVSEITPEGVVLDYQGRRFLLPRE